jgi:hypothetical protein
MCKVTLDYTHRIGIEQICLWSKKHLNARTIIRISRSPNSHVPVAACRSVGIRTRGRTAARDGKRMEGDGHPLKSRSRLSQEGRSRTATGSRRQNRRTPNLHGGRSLKQRRSGLFWSRWSSKGQHRRGLSFIAGRAGAPQSTVFRVRTFRPRSWASPSRLGKRTSLPATRRIGAACAEEESRR